MRLAPLCCYATDPDTRPDCTLTPVVAFGATRLCASCAARRSTMGKGQRPRPLETPALDVLTWLAAAEHDLRAARHALHLSLIHISEPTRLLSISYAVFCLKKKKEKEKSKEEGER